MQYQFSKKSVHSEDKGQTSIAPGQTQNGVMKMCNFFDDGLDFECKRCTACCTLEGGVVLLGKKDLENLSRHFALSEDDFIKKYCRYLQKSEDMKYYLCLNDKNGSECIFWDNGCTCYEARPVQCRTYPFWTKILESRESWDDEKKFCPGINEGRHHSREEILSELEKYKNRNEMKTASESHEKSD